MPIVSETDWASSPQQAYQEDNITRQAQQAAPTVNMAQAAGYSPKGIESTEKPNEDDEADLFLPQDEPDHVNTAPEPEDEIDRVLFDARRAMEQQTGASEAASNTTAQQDTSVIDAQEHVAVDEVEPIQRTPSPEIKTEPVDKACLVKKRTLVCLDLLGDKPVDMEWEATHFDKHFERPQLEPRVIELSDDDDDIEVQPSLGRSNDKKTQPNDKAEVITDPMMKEEPLWETFAWTGPSLDDEVISINSDDDEDVRFIWSDTSKDCIDLSNDHPSEIIKSSTLRKCDVRSRLDELRASRNPQDRAKIMKAQQLLARSMLKSGRRVGSEQPDPHADEQPVSQAEPELEEDDHSWMRTEYNCDKEAAQEFRKAKKAYDHKVRHKENTQDDDFDFIRANNIEQSRRKRLRLEYEENLGYDRDLTPDDTSETSSYPSPAQPLKRRRAAVEDGDYTESQQEGQPSAKRAQQPRAAKKGRVYNEEEEINQNLQSGIETFLEEMRDREEGTAQGEAGKAKGKKRGKGKEKPQTSGKNAKSNLLVGKKKKTRNQAGYVNDISSIWTSNVYDDATNNVADEDAPDNPVDASNTKKFLEGLVAGLKNNDKRRQDKNHIKRCVTILGSKRVTPGPEGTWNVDGMRSKLKHHQVIGSGFMKERENAVDGPWGGICADAMGLGKTVEAIALMVCNPPKYSDKSKCTLIVVQPQLVDQWYDELQKHTQPDYFEISVHCAQARIMGTNLPRRFEKTDVILTTYTEVVRSYPKVELPTDIETIEELQKWWKTEWENTRGPLHKAHFYRVILDESQAIKNHETQTSVACRGLMAKHRWAMSGTPVMNRLEEFFPYFKFLRVEGTGTMDNFQDMYCAANDLNCMTRLVCLLDKIMMRRTLKDKILGKPILTLPEITRRVETPSFNSVERTIYGIVLKRFARALNRAVKKGETKKKPSYGLLMFLRLRQLVAHPFLIQEILQDMFEMENIDRLEQATILGTGGDDNDSGKPMIDALRRLVEAKGTPVEESPEAEEPDAPKPGELAAKLGKKIRSIYSGGDIDAVRAEIICNKCKDIAEEPWVTGCLHVYCKECLDALGIEACMNDQDSTPCRRCDAIFEASEPCHNLKELQMDNFTDLTPNLSGRKKRKKVNMKFVDHDNVLVLSAKTTAVMQQLERWISEDPNKQIIVFSQFLMVMSIVERICQRKEWAYCTYNGTMSTKARGKAIEALKKDDSKIKVMVASLKCGGIGLNLTSACRVICVDLWFNSCVEEQAFCRVFRMGQKNKTEISRLVVKNSVDDRLDEMQQQKKITIAKAMDDRALLNELTGKDIMRLFGDLTVDKKTKKPLIAIEENDIFDSILPPVPEGVEDPVIANIGTRY